MGLPGMLESSIVNLFSSRLEGLLSKRAKQQQIIEALESHLEARSDNTLQTFRELFARAVQHADNDSNYTETLDKLLAAIDESGELTDLMEIALAPQENEAQIKQRIVQNVAKQVEQLNYQIPESLGGDVAAFVENLQQLLRIFIEAFDADKVLQQKIQSLRTQLAKPRYPVIALDKSDTISHNNFLKFRFDRRLVRFQKNEELNATLESFLNTPASPGANLPDVQITALYGRGGQGKSRLAFELCLQKQEQGWHAGFVQQSDNTAPIDCRWDKPCLLVLDYAGSRVEEVKALINGLKARHQQTNLTNPIRILLLERECSEKAGWFQQIVSHADTEPFLYGGGDSATGRYFPVPELDIKKGALLAASYLLRHDVFQQQDFSDEQLVEKVRAILEKASQIEKGLPRPLVIQLVAELYVADTSINYGEIEDLLEAFFQREEDTVAQFTGADKDLSNQFWQVLAVAFLAGGVSFDEFNHLYDDVAFGDWIKDNINESLFDLASLYFGQSDINVIPALEPDMLGEYLVLRQWRHWKTKKEIGFSWQQKLQQQLALALSLGTKAPESLARLCSDFPNNNPLLEKDYLLAIQKQWVEHKHKQADAYSEFLANKYFHDYLDDYVAKNLNRMEQSCSILSQCYQLQTDSKTIAKHLSTMYAGFVDDAVEASIPQMKQAMGKLSIIAEAQNQPEIWLIKAKGLVNLINHVGLQDIAAAQVLMSELSELAQSEKGGQHQPEIWLAKAKGLFNLINHVASQDIAAAQTLMSELSEVAQSEKGGQHQQDIWLAKAKGLFNLINHVGPQDILAAQALMSELSELAQSEKGGQHQPEIWLEKARGQCNLIGYVVSQDIALAKKLIKELLELAETQNEKEIWNALKRAYFQLRGLSGVDKVKALKFFNQALGLVEDDDLAEFKSELNRIYNQNNSHQG